MNFMKNTVFGRQCGWHYKAGSICLYICWGKRKFIMGMKYITRGESSPRGKQRVYFTCHPQDFSLYFEEITNCILNKQNCAVWYNDVQENEASTDDLDQIQLFVLPVSARFLLSPNRAKNVELPYAVEHHIPVLPVMMEEGLEEEFQMHCGNMQFLQYHSADKTVISFDQKLETYLKSVLADDDMARKIRDAFAAYIFLSYRKKDRLHAQKLMRLIHKNPYCRDIAIWYDEYLTPGRDFENEISDALKKSDFFVLVVTPHLLEKNKDNGTLNYVARVEYPMALAEKKEVLAVEMQSTDAATLSDLYPGISLVVAGEEQQISENLRQAVKQLAIEEKDDSTEHKFFIGLAYLSGVDVEVDYDRALALITDAANHNHEDAIRKLIQIYQTGDGVAWDYEEALKWRKRYCELAEERYLNEPSGENLKRMLDALWELGHDLQTLNHYQDAQAAFQKIHDYCDCISDIRKKMALYQKKCISCLELAAVLEKQGKYEETEQFLLEGERIALDIFKLSPTPENRRYAGVAYERIGDLYYEQGLMDQALVYYDKASNWAFDRLKEDLCLESARDVLISTIKIGRMHREFDDYNTAIECFENGLMVAIPLMEENRTLGDMRYVAILYEEIGLTKLLGRQFDEANDYLQKSLALGEEILKQNPVPQAIRDVSLSYEHLGMVAYQQADYYRYRGNTQAAVTCYKKAASYAEKMQNEQAAGELYDIYLTDLEDMSAEIAEQETEENHDEIQEALESIEAAYRVIREKLMEPME